MEFLLQKGHWRKETTGSPEGNGKTVEKPEKNAVGKRESRTCSRSERCSGREGGQQCLFEMFRHRYPEGGKKPKKKLKTRIKERVETESPGVVACKKDCGKHRRREKKWKKRYFINQENFGKHELSCCLLPTDQRCYFFARHY